MSTQATKARLRERYAQEVLPALQKEIGCANVFQVPPIRA